MSERALRPVSTIPDDDAMWKLIATGDLGSLTDKQKTTYYMHMCESLGVNPATQPFEYMELNKKHVLYAKPTLTDQLRKIHGVSVMGRPTVVDDGAYITAEVALQDATGRTDFDIGVVFVGNVQGEIRANARMKALTKAKRRATLRMCGLSVLDETEVETIPGARPVAPFPHASSGQENQPQRPAARPSQEHEEAVDTEGRVVDGETGEVVGEAPVDHKAAMRRLHAVGRDRGLDHDAIHRLASWIFDVASTTDLDAEKLSELTGAVDLLNADEWGSLIPTLVEMDGTEGGAAGVEVLLGYAMDLGRATTFGRLIEIAKQMADGGVEHMALHEIGKRRKAELKARLKASGQ